MMENYKIDLLRTEVSGRLGKYRAEHVLSTEQEAVRIAEIYLPEETEKVRISALLHDITKEYDVEKQLQILSRFGIILDNVSLASPKVLHAMTGALLVPEEFPDFADEEIISAIRKHTTGSADMSILDCVIYLADYIEPLRKFEDCQKLRQFFWDGVLHSSDAAERKIHLYKTMVLSFDFTIKNLISEGGIVAPETIAARNAFLICLKTVRGDKGL